MSHKTDKLVFSLLVPSSQSQWVYSYMSKIRSVPNTILSNFDIFIQVVK